MTSRKGLSALSHRTCQWDTRRKVNVKWKTARCGSTEAVVEVGCSAKSGGHGDPPLRPTLCRGGPPRPPGFASPRICQMCAQCDSRQQSATLPKTFSSGGGAGGRVTAHHGRVSVEGIQLVSEETTPQNSSASICTWTSASSLRSRVPSLNRSSKSLSR